MRRGRWERGPVAPGDFVTLVSVVLVAWAVATASVLRATPSSPRVVARSNAATVAIADPARVYGPVETAALEKRGGIEAVRRRDRAAENAQERRCLDERAGFYQAFPCSESEYARWLYSANNRLRAAAGAPLCWWSASVDDLRRLKGMGLPSAMLVVRLRDDEPLRPRMHPAIQSGISAGRLRRLHDDMTEECARAPRW